MRVINRSPMVLMVVSKGVTVAVYPGQEIEIDMPHPHNQRLLQSGLIREVVRVSDVPVEVKVKEEPQRDVVDERVNEKEVRVEVDVEGVAEKSVEVKEKAVRVKKRKTKGG
jgi:hypothetical protein